MSAKQEKQGYKTYTQDEIGISFSDYINQLQAKGRLNGQIGKWRERMERELQHLVTEYITPKGKMIRSPFKPDERTGSFHADDDHASGFRFSCFATGINGAGVIDFFYYKENPHESSITPEDRDEFIIRHAATHNYELNYSIGITESKGYDYNGRVKELRSGIIQGLLDYEILQPKQDGIYQLDTELSVNNVQSVINAINSNEFRTKYLSNEVEKQYSAENKSDFNLKRINNHTQTLISDTSEMLLDLVKIQNPNQRSVMIMRKNGKNDNLYNIETGVVELSLSDIESRKLPLIDFDLSIPDLAEYLKEKRELVITNDYRTTYSLVSKLGVLAATLPTTFKQFKGYSEKSEKIDQFSEKYPLIDALASLSTRVDTLYLDDEMKSTNSHSRENMAMLYIRSALMAMGKNNKIEMYNVSTNSKRGINDFVFGFGADQFIPMYDPKNKNNIVTTAINTQAAQKTFQQIMRENESIVAHNKKIGAENKGKPFAQWKHLRKKELDVPVSNFGNERYAERVKDIAREIQNVYIKNRPVYAQKQQEFLIKAKQGDLSFPVQTYKVNQSKPVLLNKTNSLLSNQNVQRVLSFNSALNEIFQSKRDNPHFQTFLKQRGLGEAVDSQGQLVYEKFNLGYSDGTEYSELMQQGFNGGLLRAAGLRAEVPSQLMLEKRITFNIQDVHNNTISFAGRVIADHTPAAPNEDISTVKYKNGMNVKIDNIDVFDKNVSFYGIGQAKSAVELKDNMIITEGYMDCIMCHSVGLENTVAAMGTSISRNKLEEAFSYTNNITMMFDGDKAGFEKAMRAAEIFLTDHSEDEYVDDENGRKVKSGKKNILPCLFDGKRDFKMVMLPKIPNLGHNANIKKGIDPDEYIQQFGGEALHNEVEQAIKLDEIIVMKAFYDVFEREKSTEERMNALSSEFNYATFNESVENNLKGVEQRIEYAKKALQRPNNTEEKTKEYQDMIDSCQSFIDSTREKSKHLIESVRWLRAASLKENISINDVYTRYGNEKVDNLYSRILFRDQCEPMLAQKYQMLAEHKAENDITKQFAKGMEMKQENELNNSIKVSQQSQMQQTHSPRMKM